MSAVAVAARAPLPTPWLDEPRIGEQAMVAAFVVSLFVGINGGVLSLIDEALFVGAFGLMLLGGRPIRFSVLAASLPLVVSVFGALSSWLGLGWNTLATRNTIQLALFGAVIGLVAPLLRHPRQLRLFAVVLVWVGVVSAVVTFLQHQGVAPFFGTTGLNRVDGRLRGAGFLGHTIWQALVLPTAAAAVPFVVRRRNLAMAAFAVIAVGTWATISRVGWVGLAAALALYVTLGPRAGDGRWRRALMLVTVGVTAISALMVFGNRDLVDETTQARIDETSSAIVRFGELGAEGLEQADDRTTTEGRIVLLNGALESVAENWTLGVGFGWRFLDLGWRTGIFLSAHNTYVSMLQLLGVIVGGGVLLGWAYHFRRAIRVTAFLPEARGPVAAMVTLAVGMLVVDTPTQMYFFAPWTIGVALGPWARPAART
ncbi:MAG: O-antigen ligase family protein [Nitriliruptorales bacterium]|nr:O-antigen ligase family protein [Nitriliruptorales bacterium]